MKTKKSKLPTIGIYYTEFGDVVLNPKVSKLLDEIKQDSMRDGRQVNVKKSRTVLSSIEFSFTTFAYLCHHAGIKLEDIFIKQP